MTALGPKARERALAEKVPATAPPGSDLSLRQMDPEAQARQASTEKSALLPSVQVLLVAAAFGGAALAVVAAGLTLPIPGTGVVTDPREIFATTGAGLTGPYGGLIIGILAGIREPDGIALASLLAHVSGGLWMGLSYKKLVYERLEMPARLLGWIAIVLVYYYLFAIPGFVIGLAAWYPDVSGGVSLIEKYVELGRGVIPEALLTVVVTTLAYLVLPRRRRSPLW